MASKKNTKEGPSADKKAHFISANLVEDQSESELAKDEDEEMDITDKGGAGSNQESTVANVKNSISTGAVKPVAEWSVDDVQAWMSEESRKAIFEHHLLRFKNNGVKGTNLLGLTDAKLATMGVASLSERDDIMAQVDSLKALNPAQQQGGLGGVNQGVRWHTVKAELDKLLELPAIKGTFEKFSKGTLAQDIAFFKPDAGHPFYNDIIQAKIPATHASNKPDLLLYGLPLKHSEKHLCNIEETVEDEEDIVDEDTAEGEPVRAAIAYILRKAAVLSKSYKSGNCIVAVGLSGCSKTSTDYGILSRRVGLYFTADVGGNGGSDDMQHMLHQISRVDNKTEEVGTRHVNALLLSRLLVLLKLLHYFGDLKLEDFAFQWLLLQIRPSQFLPCPSGCDLFHEAYDAVMKCDPATVAAHLTRMLPVMREMLGRNLLVCLDESNTLLQSCVVSFVGPVSAIPRSLFTKIVNEWQSHAQLTLIVSGTGLRLREALKIVASAIGKLLADLEKDYLVVDWGGYYDIELFSLYIKRFLSSINDEDIVTIFSIVQGRFRNSASYVTYVLEDTTSSGKSETLDRALKVMQARNCDKEHEDSKIGIRYGIKCLATGDRPGVVAGYISPMEILLKLTVSYYMFGSNYVWTDKRVLKLVDSGICPLRRTSSESLEACIAEPLVAWACYCYFKDIGNPVERHILQLMGELKLTPSSCGLLWERYVLPQIVKYLSGPLDNHPYFKEHFPKGLPAWMKGATLFVPRFGKDPNGQWISHSSRGKRNLATFLQNVDADFFIPENAAHPDAIGFLNTKDGNKRVVSAQWKLKASLSAADAVDACASTTVKNLYKTKDGKVNQNYKKRRLTVVKSLNEGYSAHLGMLRIVFLYPHTASTGPCRAENDVVVILDNVYSADLLDGEVWKFLENLKIEDQK